MELVCYTQVCYSWMESPAGKLLLAADDAGLRHIRFEHASPNPQWRQGGLPLREPMRQLQAWFAGELRQFHLTLAPEGPPFHQRVWRELLNIPYGETISYGELARRIDSPKASRAVGRANGSNPIPIVIPCHRVIGSNGKLTGYGGGLPRKQLLLAFEQRQMPLLTMTSGA